VPTCYHDVQHKKVAAMAVRAVSMMEFSVVSSVVDVSFSSPDEPISIFPNSYGTTGSINENNDHDDNRKRVAVQIFSTAISVCTA
jgi:hypothetical protein